MGLIKDLARRAAARVARRVAQKELFERPGERDRAAPLPTSPDPNPTPRRAAPVETPTFPDDPSLAELVTPVGRCRVVSLEGLLTAVRPQGRPLILHHWATWCEPCEEELPRIEGLGRALSERADLLGISWDLFEDSDDEEAVAKKVEAFAAQLGLSWDNVLVSAPPEQLFEALGLDHQKIPQTVVLGADGQVLHHARGPMDEAQISRVYALLTGS
ncbi:TlpA family protein disulfide reductase [Myxococcota bacterium]|nr:TlpA family protein disulfide reductase [Myxococcota bacterium]